MKNDGHYFCRAGGNRPDGLNEPVTAFYCVPAELYERMLDALDDQELVKLVTERSNQPLHDVDLDSYL
ncbi:type II toxin-antitoxin system Phd/YefM family antitoxin [Salmonella enterica subsp. enterica serovar Typhimurium]|nr:type II toxin-antitoxin system Phd/YefM family antitoxin [Salmonella enterica subsp. enterica serovar Typhimurium]